MSGGFPRPPPVQRPLAAPRRGSLHREAAILGRAANLRFDLEQERERSAALAAKVKQLEADNHVLREANARLRERAGPGS